MNATQRATTILIVDDDPTVRTLLRAALEDADYLVDEAEDGEVAIRLTHRREYDLVLLDVMMPRMDGFGVCEAMRGSPRTANTPIMMLTGADDVDSVQRAYTLGATDFASKPMDYVLLLYRVRHLLRSSRALEELRESERRLREAQRIARFGYWEWWPEDGTMVVSEEARAILGVAAESDPVLLDDILDAVPGDDRLRVDRAVFAAAVNRQAFTLEHRITYEGVPERVVHHEAVPRGEGDKFRFSGTVQDVTERKAAEERIVRLAYYDNVTGLPNRAFLQEHLGRALEQSVRRNRKVAVLSLDLDGFKRVNDTLGHASGDILLKEVSKRLAGCLRNGDRVVRADTVRLDTNDNAGDALGRFGGDEFVVILADIRRTEHASEVAGRILRSLTPSFTINDQEVFVTGSVGIAISGADGDDAETLIKNADAAMYYAKESGRNSFHLFTESVHARVRARLFLENDLRHALERKQFEVYYQPKIDGRNGEVLGTEALIRWRHPERGLVSPLDFIPLAEETGLIVALGEWVLETACRQTKKWQEQSLGALQIAVNVSARQLQSLAFVDVVRRVLEETRLPARCLELEITEGALIVDSDFSLSILDALKKLGVRIALDDFGTGYSSLAYLRRFPIDTLKIDRSFVRDLPNDHGSIAIASAIIAMSKSLHLNVVAEGVETQEQLGFVLAHDCNEIQGYLFSPPLPALGLEAWLAERRRPPSITPRGRTRPPPDGVLVAGDAEE
jgi:predicted signal transduction protein with EAL and GGDEF domain/DNA-binding response OmpR family regulator